MAGGVSRNLGNPVIFDSSFLMAVSERPTTWFEDLTAKIGKFEPVMLTCVRRELEKLASGQASRSRVARVALELGKSFRTVPCGRAAVDDEIASAASGMGARVATVDALLAGTLRELRVEVVSLRSGRVSIRK